MQYARAPLGNEAAVKTDVTKHEQVRNLVETAVRSLLTHRGHHKQRRPDAALVPRWGPKASKREKAP